MWKNANNVEREVKRENHIVKKVLTCNNLKEFKNVKSCKIFVRKINPVKKIH